MKRNFFPAVFLFAFFIAFLPSGHASIGKGPVQKLARGVVHVVSFPFQIPKQMLETAAQAEPAWMATWEGLTAGTGRGLFYAGRQLVSGLVDIFTFPTPSGRNWDPIFESVSLFPEV